MRPPQLPLAVEPYLRVRRRIIAGELHCPDSAQRHQALFGLGALFALVWSTLIQAPAVGYRPCWTRNCPKPRAVF